MPSASALTEQVFGEALKLGVDDLSVMTLHGRTRMIRFSNNSITAIKSWEEVVPMVYVVKEQKRAAMGIEDLKPESIKASLEALLRSLQPFPKGEVYFRLPRGPFEYGSIPSHYDPKIPELDEELVDFVEAAINAALAEGANRAAGVLKSWEGVFSIATTGGVRAEDRGTAIEITVRAFADDDASGQGNSCSATLGGFDPEKAGKRAGGLAKMARGPISGSPGKYPVILGPTIAANLMERICTFASAMFVDLGLSFLGNKLGQRVASERFTLVDDGRHPNAPLSLLFDFEGNPTQRTVVIENGVLRTFLHNSYSAAKYAAPNTGNAWYTGGLWGSGPMPRNIIVEPGEHALEELMEMADGGIYLTNNWYTRFQNYQSGDFSTICRDAAFTIRKGELEKPVKGLRLSDNLQRMLLSIKGLTKDREWVKWWEVDHPTLTPYMLIEDVQLTTATM